MKNCFIAAFLAFVSLTEAHAAEITVSRASGYEVITIEGPLNREDGVTFRNVMAKTPRTLGVAFNSKGGSLQAGLLIGGHIRDRGLMTLVQAKMTCASACALAWLGGTRRYVDSEAKVGFHAAYEMENGKPVERGEDNALVGAYLTKLGLSYDAVRYVTRARPESMTWMTIDVAKTLGIEVEPGQPLQPNLAEGAKLEDIIRKDFEIADRVNTVVGWDAFLKQYPNGFLSTLARERRAKAEAIAAASPKTNDRLPVTALPPEVQTAPSVQQIGPPSPEQRVVFFDPSKLLLTPAQRMSLPSINAPYPVPPMPAAATYPKPTPAWPSPNDRLPRYATIAPLGQAVPSTSPQQIAPSSERQRVVLYDEDPADPKGNQYVGSVVWRTEPINAMGNQRPGIAVRADIEIPDRKFRMTMLFRRNTDVSLPASHTAELTFILPPDFVGGAVASVPGILMKSNERARGTPLAALAVKVTDGFFLVGLSNVDADRTRNVQLIMQQGWFDVPIVYANKRRAILAIEKGVAGERALSEAVATWDAHADPSLTEGKPGVFDVGSGARYYAIAKPRSSHDAWVACALAVPRGEDGMLRTAAIVTKCGRDPK